MNDFKLVGLIPIELPIDGLRIALSELARRLAAVERAVRKRRKFVDRLVQKVTLTGVVQALVLLLVNHILAESS